MQFEPITPGERRELTSLLDLNDRPAPTDHYGDPKGGWAKSMFKAIQAFADARLQANAVEPYDHSMYELAERALRGTLQEFFPNRVGDTIDDIMLDGDHNVLDAVRYLLEQAPAY